MDPRHKLFRKAALEKMASPERLDEMMMVTSPKGWLTLAAVGLLLVAAIFWSLFGTIPVKVRGNGILKRGEAVLDVSSGASGRLDQIAVQPGDVVSEGDVIATVSQPDLSLRIENTQEELETLLQQTEEQAIGAGRVLAQLQSQRRDLRERIATQESLASRGLVTKNTLLSSKAQLASVEQSIAQHEVTRSARKNRLDEVRRELEELESKLAGSSQIKSPYAGRVLEMMVDPGNLVGAGTRLLTLEALEGPIDAVIYIPAADGKKVRQGMEVRVSPSTVRAEEYGFIIGEVHSVSTYPVTPEGIARVLRNEKLVQALAGEAAPIEVVAALIEDLDTESGFRWSSSEGPPNKVFTGTICSASVIVEKRRPISYVLPIFKGALGVG